MLNELLVQNLPAFANDIKINLGNLLNSTILNDKQKALLSATLLLNDKRKEDFNQVVVLSSLNDTEKTATEKAFAIMNMNNVYYRFLHSVENHEYEKMPAKLRMQAIGNHGIESVDFELMALAISAVNGCGRCMDSHEKVLRQKGVSAELIQETIKFAAVLHARNVILSL
jgi:lipoyl-dependent peroxiredoxin subunit D